jgi:Spy/CpxP family protein refolding chaperone
MMVGLLVVAGMAGVAGAQAPQRDREPGARSDRARAGKRGDGVGMRGLLRGIELSEAEKGSLRTVGEKYRTQFQAIRESMRPDMDASRAARQRGDTVAARIAYARTADERTQLAALAERMHADARAALAPEHRAQFDTNIARVKERRANRRDSDGWDGRREGRKRGRRV